LIIAKAEVIRVGVNWWTTLEKKRKEKKGVV